MIRMFQFFARIIYPILIILGVFCYSIYFITWTKERKPGFLLKIATICLGIALGFFLATVLIHFI